MLVGVQRNPLPILVLVSIYVLRNCYNSFVSESSKQKMTFGSM